MDKIIIELYDKNKATVFDFKCLYCFKQFVLTVRDKRQCLFCGSLNIKNRAKR